MSKTRSTKQVGTSKGHRRDAKERSDIPSQQHEEEEVASAALKIGKTQKPLSAKDKITFRRILRLFALAELTKTPRMRGF